MEPIGHSITFDGVKSVRIYQNIFKIKIIIRNVFKMKKWNVPPTRLTLSFRAKDWNYQKEWFVCLRLRHYRPDRIFRPWASLWDLVELRGCGNEVGTSGCNLLFPCGSKNKIMAWKQAHHTQLLDRFRTSKIVTVLKVCLSGKLRDRTHPGAVYLKFIWKGETAR